MKKFVKVVALVMALVTLACVFTSCSNISESYAKKINKAAEKDEHYTLDQVLEDLGDDAVNVTILGSGVVIAVKGCDSMDDIKEKIDDGKTVKGIVVTVLANKATAAEYKEITKEDLK